MTLKERLTARSNNAYLHYIDICRRSECTGEDIKMERGEFGERELKAHRAAAEMLGRHRAYAEMASDLASDEASTVTAQS
jgi:hypothetical protein